jgi:phosphoglycolate phosphatase-like HAD superfamily hydrolase
VHLAGSTDPQIVTEMARTLGLSPEEFTPRAIEFEDAYLRHLRVTVRESPSAAACPGVEDLLERLERHPRITLGLLTGNIEGGARIKLGRFGLDRFFSFGGFGGDGRDRSELAVEARQRATALTGTTYSPEHSLVVGDTVHDVRAGRANGYLTVGVGTGWASMDVLREEGADAVFADLTPENGFEDWLAERWELG